MGGPLAFGALRPMSRWLACLALLAALPLLGRSASADAIVAADGTGQFCSVQDAISAAPMRTGAADPRWVIFVKAGVYHERVYVQRERGNIHILGEDAATTVIAYDLHANLPGPDGKPLGTFRTPTVQIDGDGMLWENVTIANIAGEPGPRAGAPPVAQALALRVDGDRVVFRHCRFLGWQDTMLVNRGRHYLVDCYIEGSVDFIFGAATAYFDRCHIHCLGDGYITAASTPEGQPHGLVFADCKITGVAGVKSYLGRPWRDYAKTVFLRTQMSAVVRPEGWHNWSKPHAELNATCAEFANTGPGALLAGRVAWMKHPETGDSARYTPAAVLAGQDHWRPVAGPVLHLVGDSTMADKPDDAFPERGWGQLFRELVRPPLRVVNHAANGRSTKSFRTLGHWQRLLDQLADGDWVLIEFGHNDAKKDDPVRYAEPAVEYPNNLRQFVREVHARGAHPILATSVVRRSWSEDGVLRDSHGLYLTAVRTVAAEEQVPLLDLEQATRALVTSLGPAGSKPLLMIFAPGEHPQLPAGRTDNTHFTARGARLVAALAAEEMRRLHLPFADNLMKPDSTPWSPDLGDGTYKNPLLHADYSDPDAVRVGEDYWMTASSFSHVPGLPLLHSCDLVNWELTGYALPRLVPEETFATPQPGKGVWAPAIRHHAGKYWIYYPDPDFGLYVITATDPRGPWSAPVLVRAGKGLIDPCPLWDDDGKVYLIHAWAKSRAGINNVLTLLRLDATGTRVEEDLGVVIDGHKIPDYTTLEGPKFYKRGGWYYVFAPAGGVATGWQSVFRARDIRGPYEARIVLDQGLTPINGPHQGALVDTPSGEWWFLHFQDLAAYGRVVHLQPVVWRDDWPVIGADPDGDGKGEPVLVHRKPALPTQPPMVPPTSDEFDATALSVQWQWQANARDGWLSLTAQPGALRLFAQPEPKPGNLYDAPNLLLQKFPAPEFTVTTKLEFSPQAVGDSAGLVVFGLDYVWLGLKKTSSGPALVLATCPEAVKGEPARESIVVALAGGAVWLRVTVRSGGQCRFSFSRNGADFTPASETTFTAMPGRWVGAKVGLFAFGTSSAYGDFDFFRVGEAVN